MGLRIIGIDPGLHGGIALLNGGLFERAIPMPVKKQANGKLKIDAFLLAEELLKSEPDLVVIEKVGAMPGQGVTSMFNFGYGAGLIEGVVGSLRFEYEFVVPQVWMHNLFRFIPKDAKKPSIQYVQTNYPNVNLLATKRSRTPHNGMADAICLAEYGHYQYGFAKNT